MSTREARDYVDLVIESLVDNGHMTDDAYGRLTEEYQQQLAEQVAAKSEE